MKKASMNSLYRHLVLTFFLFLLLLSLPSLVHAQIIDPGCDPLDPSCPIDGGLVFLLAAGAGYGIKRSAIFKKKPASDL